MKSKRPTVRERLAEALSVSPDRIWKNPNVWVAWRGAAQWGVEGTSIHSFDRMTDCVRFGFDKSTDGCVTAKSTKEEHGS